MSSSAPPQQAERSALAGPLGLIAALACGAAGTWLLWDKFFGLMDSPYVCVAAQVANGEQLYRDTAAVITPVSIWSVAWLMSVFGPTITVARLGLAILTGLESALIWGTARRLGARAGWAILAVIFVIIWGVNSGPVGGTVGGAVRVASFIAGAAILCFLLAPPRLGLLCAFGLAALAFWTYQQSGVHLVIALGLWVGYQLVRRAHRPDERVSDEDKRKRLRIWEWLALPVAGLVLGSAPVLIWAVATGVLGSMWNLVWVTPRHALGEYLFAWEQLAGGLYPHGISRGAITEYLATGAPHPWALAGWLMALAYWSAVRKRLDPGQSERIAFLGLYSGVGFAACAWHPIPYRLFLHVMTPLAPVLCWAVGDMLSRGQKWRVRKLLAPAALLLFMLWGAARTAHELHWRAQVRVATPAGTVWMREEDAEWVDRAVTAIGEHSPPGSRCYIIGRGQWLHLMTRTWPATPYSITTAVVFGPEQFQDYAHRLQQERPEVVFGAMRRTSDLAANPFSSVLYSALTADYEVHEAFQSRLGEFTVWRLRRGTTRQGTEDSRAKAGDRKQERQ